MIHFPGPFVQKGGPGPPGPPLAMALHMKCEDIH